MSLPGLDEWLTREPREYAAEDPCPECSRQLVDAHECACGWNEYAAIEDGAASARGGGVVAGIDPRPEVYQASPCTARDDALDPACAAGRKR